MQNLKTSKSDVKEKQAFLFKWRWEYFLLLLMVAEFAIFGSMNPRFLNPAILMSSINNFVPVCIIALFVTFVIITGGIDIQAGSIIGLTSISLGVLWQKMGVNIWLAALISLLIGILCGLISGLLIALTDVQPMVITLGGSFLFSGLALVVPSIAKVEAYQGITNFPIQFTDMTNGAVLLGIPNQVIIFLILIAIAFVVLHLTQYGRKIFLLGINRSTAEYSGIKTAGLITSTYVLSGLSASIAGVMMTSYLGTAKPDFGSDLTLPIITAVVLGGTSIYGGKGNIIGTALSSLIIGFMQFGLSLVGIQAQYQAIPVGILLVASLIINFFIRKGIFKKLTNLFMTRREKSV